MPEATTSPDQPVVVATPAGPVTLADLDDLKARLNSVHRQASDKLEQARSLDALHAARLAATGQVLVDHASEWTPDEMTAGLIREAIDLQSRITADESQLEAIGKDASHGLNGVVNKMRRWTESRHVAADQATLKSQLNAVLTKIGEVAPDIDLPSVSSVRAQTQSAEEQSNELRVEADALTSAAQLLQDEINRRKDALKQMGFDSLYTAAYLKTYGPESVTSPLNLKRDERAILAVQARLARNQTRTRWVGGSQGFSFPIGHTGIRYRVGSYHGHPVQQQVLATLDVGTLVVTTQRISFVGRTKTVAVPLSKLLHVECYSDALAVFQEGRENGDYYFLTNPKYVLFMINWVSGDTGG